MKNFDTLVVITPQDFIRLESQYEQLVKNITFGRIYFVGAKGVKEALEKSSIAGKVGYINEDDIIPFNDVHEVMKAHMEPVLMGRDLPRGVTGWYYQQFLKMQYTQICENEYYMTWDGDTIPTAPFSMFKEGTDTPYMDLKVEMHQEYFDTMGILIPGMRKCIEKSFISEHMLFNVSLMKMLINKIMENDELPGEKFYEKIIHAITPERIQQSSFSEFETYGTFVCFNDPSAYRLRDWHSFRLAGEFFDPNTICERDYKWLSQDFFAVSFEKGHFVRDDHKNLFDNPEYQKKLSPRKMLEEAQLEFKDGYKEVWSGNGTNDKVKNSASDYEYMYFNNLGDYYENINPDKAFLCYEQAVYLCKDDALRGAIDNKLQVLKNTKDINVNKAAIIIVSYNCKYLMEKCIESIRNTTSKDMVDIIVTDNASTDGVTEYLESLDDIVLIKNEENAGFPKGCNIGISRTDSQDIFLLNNDTRLTKNALFWLRMGLYEDKSVGATGAVANYACIDQLKDVTFETVKEYEEYGATNNVAMKNPYEEKSRLSGFAMLIKREAFDRIGMLDETFSPGYFEDDDLSTGIHSLGYKLCICHNAFIYHAGSQSFVKRNDIEAIMARNLEYITNKWGYEIFGSSYVDEEEIKLLRFISHNNDEKFRLLEVGAGSGNLLTRIKHEYPEADLYGLDEEEGSVWNSVNSVPVMKLDGTFDRLPFPEGYFDYIIVYDRYNRGWDKDMISEKLSGYLGINGQIIC